MKIVKIGDQMSIEKLMVNEPHSPSGFNLYKLASQLKISMKKTKASDSVDPQHMPIC